MIFSMIGSVLTAPTCSEQNDSTRVYRLQSRFYGHRHLLRKFY